MKYAKSIFAHFSLWCLLPIGIVLCAVNHSEGQTILFDGSGSMKGFFETGEAKRLWELLQSNSGGASNLYFFIDERLETEPPNIPGNSYGNYTYIHSAFREALSKGPSILWIVSDNQPSIEGAASGDEDLEKLYSELGSDIVKRIYIFPLKLNFAGVLLNEDGFTALGNYSGPRGLLIYALLLDEKAKNEFEVSVHKVEERFNQTFANKTKSIFIKPLGENTVTTKLKAGNKLSINEKNGIIGREFEAGKPIEGSFTVELTSELEHLAIDESKILATPTGDFQTGDFNIGDFNIAGLAPSISPGTIKLDPKGTAKVDVRLHLDSVNIRMTPMGLWHCLTQNRGVINGQIKISIEVPHENFSVMQGLLDQFSTDNNIYQNTDPETQSKIWGLNSLMRKMIPAQDVIRPMVGNNAEGIIPVRLEVRYPKWPTLIAILFFGLPIMLVIGTAIFVRRQPLYRLKWNSGQYRACSDFKLWPLRGQSIEIDNQTAVQIGRSMLSGVWIKARRGYTVDDVPSKSIRPDGTDFVVRRAADDAVVNFSLSNASVTSHESRHAEGPDSYGTGSTSDADSSTATGPPPIRKVTTGRKYKSDSSPLAALDDDNDLDSLYR